MTVAKAAVSIHPAPQRRFIKRRGKTAQQWLTVVRIMAAAAARPLYHRSLRAGASWATQRENIISGGRQHKNIRIKHLEYRVGKLIKARCASVGVRRCVRWRHGGRRYFGVGCAAPLAKHLSRMFGFTAFG